MKRSTFVIKQGRIGFWMLLVFLLGVLAIGNLQAQVEKATLSGTVLDPSEALIVGASIQANSPQILHG